MIGLGLLAHRSHPAPVLSQVSAVLVRWHGDVGVALIVDVTVDVTVTVAVAMVFAIVD